MKHPREIIVAPIVTEKSNTLNATQNCYTFRVSVNANKIEIRKAIETIFNVSVVRVNTLCQNGKVKRMGRSSGKRADWKKAIVKLKAGDKISEIEV
ncbi:MAG: 50S ribosomal protein L23 [Candidatus Cloacimonetes bacterium]|nr:50S ribosomal protein L23 [Candidatus Cloacimonadota bacterium]